MRAMILCAGRGERMRPLTDTTPKPLLPVGGKPLVVHAIERLRAAGVRDIVINHAHLGAMIETALGDGTRYGVSIRYSPEAEALETAGGIATALPLLDASEFIVVNGDVYCEHDLAALCRSLPDGALAHLVLVDNPDHHLRGDFALEGDHVVNRGGAMLTFSGLGRYRAGLFAGIAPGTKAQLAPLLRTAADRGQLQGEHYRGCWRDIGTPERLAELDRKLAARGA